MLACIAPVQFSSAAVLLAPPAPNNVVQGTTFHRCSYHEGALAMTGVYIVFSLKPAAVAPVFKRSAFSFTREDNAETIGRLERIEVELANKLGVQQRALVPGIAIALQAGEIRGAAAAAAAAGRSTTRFMLRVSGLWRSDVACGVVFRVLPANHPL